MAAHIHLAYVRHVASEPKVLLEPLHVARREGSAHVDLHCVPAWHGSASFTKGACAACAAAYQALHYRWCLFMPSAIMAALALISKPFPCPYLVASQGGVTFWHADGSHLLLAGASPKRLSSVLKSRLRRDFSSVCTKCSFLRPERLARAGMSWRSLGAMG